MNFLVNTVSTVSNAIEINKLKDERTLLNKEKETLNKKIKEYDNKNLLKNTLEKNIETNDLSISSIKEYFILSNIKIEQNETTATFGDKYKDEYLIKMFKLLTSLQITNQSLANMINEIKSQIQIDKNVYQTRLNEIETKVEKINSKLKIVREKQFGSK